MSSQPLEFRASFRSRLSDLYHQVELFRDPAQDVRILQLCLGGGMTPAARLTLRATTYAQLFQAAAVSVLKRAYERFPGIGGRTAP